MTRKTVIVPWEDRNKAVAELFTLPLTLLIGKEVCEFPDYFCVKVEIMGQEVIRQPYRQVAILEATYDNKVSGPYLVGGRPE